MKNSIVTSIILITVSGLLSGCQQTGEKNFKEETSFEVGSIEEIEINSESWDIELQNTETENIIIAVDGKQKGKNNDPVIINNEEKKVTVKQRDEKGISSGFSFGKEGTISISIPKKKLAQITLNNTYGDIKVMDAAAENITVSNDSGTGKIEGLSAEKGKFISKDGEWSLENSSVKELIVTSAAGDNYITNVISSKGEITSTDGEIIMKDAIEGESLRAETKSGDITISYKETPTSLKVTANSNSFDITVDLNNFKKTVNAENSIEGTVGDRLNKLEAISKNGVINITE
ncbi:DUF4097 family beta strand repeat-containing protein [Metabacillus fastidiosus]|uniref:DUF4097 family beta strand repeat-containing protein n=1 Tax=Metabacillus fastidiosus TaxID=1458 RepID=UPI002E23683E|nr:DUF4097 family beta strand repeat-containing protein [Metabacillus fastidiosus]